MRECILGTDWWTDCDDAVALRLLARAHKRGEMRLLAIALNGCMEHSVTSIEGFLNTEEVYDIPIGIDLAATDFGGNPPYQKRLSAYAKTYRNNEQAENATVLYRRILANAETPVELIEIGYPQVLADVLRSNPDEVSPLCGSELVAQKVSKIWMMAGKWDCNPDKENNFARNERSRRAAHFLCEYCPVPITFLGWEVGATVISGGELNHNDPLYGALCDHGSPNGRSSWDPMLCLLALHGNEEAAGYGLVRGRAAVDAETGENHFTPDPQGPHAYVVKQHADAYYAAEINQRIARE